MSNRVKADVTTASKLQFFNHLVTGAAHGTAWEIEKVRGNVTLAMLTLAIISVIASLGVFGKDRLIFCREAASGNFARPLFYLCHPK